jgi:hypothetical protein
LSDATHLVLAFDAGGPMSPGTARTLVESFRLGHSIGRVRRNGMIEEVPLAHYWRRIDFAGGSAMAIAIPWGDLATAEFSTSIPNIETGTARFDRRRADRRNYRRCARCSAGLDLGRRPCAWRSQRNHIDSASQR